MRILIAFQNPMVSRYSRRFLLFAGLSFFWICCSRDEKTISVWLARSSYEHTSHPYVLELREGGKAFLWKYDIYSMAPVSRKLQWKQEEYGISLGGVDAFINSDSLVIRSRHFINEYDSIYRFIRITPKAVYDEKWLNNLFTKSIWTRTDDSTHVLELHPSKSWEDYRYAIERITEEGWTSTGSYSWWISDFGGVKFLNRYKLLDSYWYGLSEPIIHITNDTLVVYSINQQELITYHQRKRANIDSISRLLAGTWIASIEEHVIEARNGFMDEDIFRGKVTLNLKKDGQVELIVGNDSVAAPGNWRLNMDGSIVRLYHTFEDGQEHDAHFYNILELNNDRLALTIEHDGMLLTRAGFKNIGSPVTFTRAVD